MGKNIVIVGAGYAGILTAKKLAKKLKKNKISNVSVTIIDKNPYHTMLTELHEVAANRVEEDSIRISLKRVFAQRKVDVKLDTVTAIDFDGKLVKGANENYPYDYLVLSAGSKPTFFGVPGAKEYAFKLWSYEDALILREHIQNSFRLAASETNVEQKKKLLHFAIVGAGFTGVELVGELAEYVPILCDKYEIDRELVTITNLDSLSRVVPTLTPELSQKVERRLKKLGVTVKLNTAVVSIGGDYIETKCNDVVTRENAGTVVWAAGIESSQITEQVAQKLQSAGRGRIKVDSYLRSLDDEHVFIAGDNMLYIPQGEERPVPQVVENCEQSADTVAHNLFCALTGSKDIVEYKPAFHGIMVSLGGRYGVARVGTPKHMINLASFFAMFAKHFINVVYFVQVLGWNKVFSYVKHEFFTIRNCRSFLGGHFSNRTPSFLLVPLRIWLGSVWLFEGIKKIAEGWMVTPKLTGFFGGSRTWFDSFLNAAATATGGSADAVSAATGVAQGAADAATAATGVAQGAVQGAANAVATVGTKIFSFNFLGLFRAIFVSGKEIIQSSINDYAFKLDVPLMNWFVDKLILPSDTVQLVMQVIIVIAEILIGLALIGGLFTTPATALSLVLQFMFICTTGLYLGTFWMIFAGIALLIGSGRTLGLDYYFMPYLKKKWKKVPLAQRSYLYHD